MAISVVAANRGTAGNKTNSTTITVSPTAALAEGNYAILSIGTDNVGTAVGDTTDITVADDSGDGQSWIRIKEVQGSNGATDDHARAAVFYKLVGTGGIATTDTITVTFSAIDAKGIILSEVAVGSGSTLEVATGGTNHQIVTAGDFSVAISGLTSEEHLWIGVNVLELGTGIANDPDDGFTALAVDIGSAGGAGHSNINTSAGYLIETGTGQTYDKTGGGSGDRATVLVAFREVAGSTGQEVTPGLIDVSSSVFAPTVTPGGVSLTPGLIDQTSEVFAPQVSLMTDIGLIDQTSEVFAPSLSLEFSVGLIDHTSEVYAPTVNQSGGAQEITPALLDYTSEVFAPTFGLAATIGLLDHQASLFEPRIDQQVVPGLIDHEAQVFEMQADQAVTPGLIDQEAAVFAPQVNQGVEIGLIDSSASLFSPTVSGGDDPDAPQGSPFVYFFD